MEDAPKKEIRPEIGMGDIFAAAWRSLRSTQTTVGLLTALAVASGVGILVPQGAPAQEYTQRLGKALGPVIVHLGLDHVFSSWWYLLLLGLVICSAAACAKRMWRLGRDLAAGPPLALLQRKLAAEGTSGETAKLNAGPEDVLAQLTGSCRRHRYRVTGGADEAGAIWLVCRKHGWAGYGMVLSHLAIFGIALGALLGVWPGAALDKPVNLTEQEVYQDPDHSFDFALRLNSFALEYYPDQTTVKAYKSDVSVLEGDREVKRQSVLVNHPLSYRHVQFYQSSYGIGGFALKVTPPQGEPEELLFPLVPCSEGDGCGMYDIPSDGAVQFTAGKQAAIVARGFSPDGSESASPMPGAGGGDSQPPAAQITMVSGFGKGGDHAFTEVGWIKQGQPTKVGDYVVELEGVRQYTGLNARRDYGIPLVWLGFAALVVGLMATFYFKPHSLLARLTQSGSGVKVTLAAFEKGGAGGERWQAKPYPVVGQILAQLDEQNASPSGGGLEGREEDGD